jgi:hypothetical protein
MYSRIGVSGIAIAAALLVAMSAPVLRADSANKKTVLAVSEAVQVPGAVLQPGTYVFELPNNPLDRNIVRVFDEDQSHLLTTFMAIPDYRSTPTNHTVIQLEEREANAPQAIHTWFYAGESDGLEFIYPK